MKKNYFLIILSIVYINSYSQYLLYSTTIDLETNSQLIEIDTSQAGNLWQIGIPQKLLLDSSYSNPYGIITDTINNYPVNNLSSFQVKFLPYFSACWGYGYISFRHKYDFDLNKDGGYIEVQYDNDTNWINIINDPEPFYLIDITSYYTNSDTIIGNIPAFTGNSNGWVYSYLAWQWELGVKGCIHDSLTIRFTMKSDSAETNHEGWLIDDIELYLEDVAGSVSENKYVKNEMIFYPNPTTGVISITNEGLQITGVEVFDIYGKEVMKSEVGSQKTEVDLSQQPKGIYIIKVTTGKGVAVEKVVLE